MCNFHRVAKALGESKYLVHLLETPTRSLGEEVIDERHHCRVTACKYDKVGLSHFGECDWSDKGDQDVDGPGAAYAEAVDGCSQMERRNLRGVDIRYRTETDNVAEVEQEDEEHGTAHC